MKGYYLPPTPPRPSHPPPHSMGTRCGTRAHHGSTAIPIALLAAVVACGWFSPFALPSFLPASASHR